MPPTDREKNRFSARAKRYANVGTKVGGGVSVPRPPAAEFTRIWQG